MRELPAETLRQLERLTFVSRRHARAGVGGEHVSRRPAPSTDFIDYRPYHPGDDFRRIDWNVYGRLGALQVKVTEGRERLDVLLVLDCSSSMDFGNPSKLDVGAQLVTALAHIGAGRADGVRVTCLGRSLPGRWPLRRRSHVSELVRELARLTPAGRVDLNATLSACVPADAPPHALAVVVSDLMSPAGIQGALDTLRARVADIAVVHVVAPEELQPNISGEVELIDAETGVITELGVSQATLSAYRTRFTAWLDARESDCRARGLRYTRVTTDTPIATAVLRNLREMGLLK